MPRAYRSPRTSARAPKRARDAPITTCGACGGKNVYASEGQAQRTAVRRSTSAGPLRVYRCPHGTGWHLTSRT